MEGQKAYIIDQLFPVGEVHLIAGPSGSGKTTWLFQMLQAWIKGEPVLDYESYPCKWAYIACDRSLNSIRTTMKRVGVEFEKDVYVDSMVDNINLQTMEDVLARMQDKGVEFLVLEGIGSVVPGGKINDYDIIANFLRGLTRWCTNKRLSYDDEEPVETRKRTILATTHMPKMKEKEKYELGRDKVIGSTAWGAFSDTIVTIESVLTKQAELEGKDLRQVSVMPRNAKNFMVQYILDEKGKFVQYSATDGDSLMFLLDMFFMQKDVEGLFTREQINAYLKAKEFDTEDAMVVKRLTRWFDKLVSLGYAERTKKGTYKKLKEEELEMEAGD